MATTKKASATKTTAKKPGAKAPIKKTASKAAVKGASRTVATKTTSTRKASTKPAGMARKAPAKKQAAVRSFHLDRNPRPFTSFRITEQTIYWILLVAVIIFVQLWILKLQYEVVAILDAQQALIEAN